MTLSDDENEDIQTTRSEFERMMRRSRIKLDNFLRMYQVNKYPARILKAKENYLLERIETHTEENQELVFQFLENKFINDEDWNKADSMLEGFMAKVSDYMAAYLTKIHDIGSQVQSSVSVNLPDNNFNSILEPQQSAYSSDTQAAEQAEQVSLENELKADIMRQYEARTGPIIPDPNVSVKAELMVDMDRDNRKLSHEREELTPSYEDADAGKQNTAMNHVAALGNLKINFDKKFGNARKEIEDTKRKLGEEINSLIHKLANNENTANIGYSGLHESFMHYSNQVGSSKTLFTCFVDSLKIFKKFGLPGLPTPIITYNNLKFFNTDKEIHGKEESLADAQYHCVNSEVRLNNCCCSGHCVLAHFEGTKKSGAMYESLAVQMSAARVIELPVHEDDDDPVPLVRPIPVGPHAEVLAVLTALET